jgi:RNA polymerase sigma-70 factor (ECF subfamily)
VSTGKGLRWAKGGANYNLFVPEPIPIRESTMTTTSQVAETIDRQGIRAEDSADVACAAGGDVAAFERLYRRHVGRVFSLACRMVGSEEAPELTQDVFVRTWRKLGTFRGDAAFGSWLYRLAINVIYAHQRKRAKERARTVASEIPLAVASSRRDAADIRLDFDVAIERLPDGAREVFVLHDVEGYKHREIADMIGITPGTSKSQLHRARMLLRDHLDR